MYETDSVGSKKIHELRIYLYNIDHRVIRQVHSPQFVILLIHLVKF